MATIVVGLRRACALAVAMTLACAATAQESKVEPAPTPAQARAPLATFGPDAFGYRGFDGGEPECTFQYIDISASGTNVVTGDDEGVPVTLPGPPFDLYGQSLGTLAVTTNGYLSSLATDDGPDLSNDCPLPALPSTGGGARIYPLHDDLEAVAAAGGGVFFQYFPTCPRPSGWGGVEGCYVVQWHNVNHFGTSAARFSFQALLYTTSYGIVFQHLPGNPESGSGSTTGLQNATVTIGLNYACNSASSIGTNTSNRAQCIYHPAFPPGSAYDLALTITDTPDPVTPGANISYVATSTNAGPATANEVVVTVPVATGTGFVSAQPSSGGNCVTPAVGASGDVTCTFAGATGSGTSRSVTVVAQVPSSAAQGTVFSVSASTAAQAPDANSANNTAVASTTVGAPSADLSITLSGTPDPVVAGAGQITYSATITNGGVSDAQGVALNLPMASGTTFVSASASAGGICTTPAAGANGTVTCSWAGATAPGAGAARSATIVVGVPANVLSGTVLSVTGTASSSTADPGVNPNTATTSTTVNATANLSATLADTPDPVTAGTNLTYTATVGNLGPSDAQNAQISLPLPAGTSLVSANAPGGTCTGTTTIVCVWSGATAPSVTRTATIVALVATSVANGSTLTATNTASSSSTPTPATASTTTAVNATAALQLGLTASPASVNAGGGVITYVATATNNGPSDAAALTITVPFPPELGATGAVASAGGSCSGTTTVTCTWPGGTAPGVTRTATITATVLVSASRTLFVTATANSGSTVTAVTATAGVNISAPIPVDAPRALLLMFAAMLLLGGAAAWRMRAGTAR